MPHVGYKHGMGSAEFPESSFKNLSGKNSELPQQDTQERRVLKPRPMLTEGFVFARCSLSTKTLTHLNLTRTL